MTEQEIEKEVAFLRANFAFEGMKLTKDDERDARAILRGEAMADELIAKALRECDARKEQGVGQMTNDLTTEMEVLDEYAAGVLADFDRYLIKHGQEYGDGSPVGEKALT
jgi:hypothetical protein